MWESVNSALAAASSQMPEGWRAEIHIERGEVSVFAIGPDEVPILIDAEGVTLSDKIHGAVIRADYEARHGALVSV